MRFYAILTTSIFMFASTLTFANTCVIENRDDSAIDSIIQINSSKIGKQEYLAALQLKARKLFYHLAAPEAKETDFRLEIANDIINDRLLAWYAIENHKLSADENDLKVFEAQLIEQFSDNEQFDNNQSLILDFYLCREEREQLINLLKQLVERKVKASKDEVKAYYNQHPDKFTSPIQNHIGVILIGVEAGLPKQEWDDARAEAQRLHLMLTEGADFSKIAKEYSSDISARDGGDMGYQHEGMLGEYVENTLKDLNTGDISEPFFLLEGWAIIKLIDRQEPALNPLKKVKNRAEGLLLREKKEQAWTDLIDSLRQEAEITIDENAINAL